MPDNLRVYLPSVIPSLDIPSPLVGEGEDGGIEVRRLRHIGRHAVSLRGGAESNNPSQPPFVKEK